MIIFAPVISVLNYMNKNIVKLRLQYTVLALCTISID
jgi:glycopeptide antibiotics resistance protein